MTPVDGLGRLAATTLMASFTGPVVPDWVRRRVEDGLGSVCLFGSNLRADDGTGAAGVEAAARVSAVLHAARPSVVVAIDEEGGAVTRLEVGRGSSIPGNAALGAVDDVALTHEVASALGQVLLAAGVDLDLAPCADVNSDPRNPVIGVRSFGADSEAVGRHVAAFVAGLQEAGVAACAKHFPGHGATTVDSHLGLPEIDVSLDVLRRRELPPFRAAVDVGVAAVMLGHLRVTAVDDAPATVSARVVGDLLRDELGFTGAVVTDALDMGGIGGARAIPANVVRALAAGADLCCLGPDATDDLIGACIEAVVGAVRCGSLDEERLVTAAGRVAGFTSLPTNPPSFCDRNVALEHHPPPDPALPPYVAAAAPPLRSGRSVTEPFSSDAAEALAALAALGTAAAERAVQVDGPAVVPLRRAHVVQVTREPLIAEGQVPWGVAAALGDRDPSTTTRAVSGLSDVPAALTEATGRPLVVVVRDPQSRDGNPEALAILDSFVGARPDAVVVDMGWPDLDLAMSPRTSRLRTFGSGRVSGEAAASTLSAPSGRNVRG